jgi:mannose-6-phosphate isomerase-like protein (cupin superfamily)
MALAALDYAYDSIQTGLAPYHAGDRDERPWGHYRVISTGIRRRGEFCEKRIIINPGSALSLQRHRVRWEEIHVLEGEVQVIIDAALKRKSAGDRMEVPLHAIHSFVNLGERPVLLYERQEGICRESDNERLCDINGRPIVRTAAQDALARESIRLYRNITALLAA